MRRQINGERKITQVMSERRTSLPCQMYRRKREETVWRCARVCSCVCVCVCVRVRTFICCECAALKRAIDACDWVTVKSLLMRPDPEKAKEEQGEEAMDRRQSPLYIRVRTTLQHVAPLHFSALCCGPVSIFPRRRRGLLMCQSVLQALTSFFLPFSVLCSEVPTPCGSAE